MRKIILRLSVVCVWLVCAIPSFPGELGIKGGVSLSGLHSATGDFRHFLGYEMDWLKMRNYLGFQLGFFKTVDISKHFQFQPEINYSLRGGDASEAFIFEDVVYKIKLSYLEVPLLLKYSIPLKGKVKPVVLLGPYGALKLSAKKYSEIWGDKETTSLGNVKSFDYGVILGVGADINMFSGELLLEFRSQWGLPNIMDIPEGYIKLYSEKDKINNFAFAAILGYSF